MNIIKVLKEIEASLAIGSAAEASIRDVMLKEVRNALHQAPDTIALLKEQKHFLDFLRGIIECGEVKVPETYIGHLDNVIDRTRQMLFALEPQFAHQVNGVWHFSTDLPNPPSTLEGYRQRIKVAYGSTVKIRFATRGSDYDIVLNGHPAKGDYYI